MKGTLIVMVKVPRPGRVKTRLAAEIGTIDAAWWYRRQVTRLLRRVDDPRWQAVLAVSPDREGLFGRAFKTVLPRIEQGPGDLGDRMARLMRNTYGPVCIIGSDIPSITREHISRAFAALGNHDAVFGPAQDGGYWLIGLKRNRAVPAHIFKGVRWSTRHALADTISTLPDFRIALIDRLRDVDTADDLRMT